MNHIKNILIALSIALVAGCNTTTTPRDDSAMETVSVGEMVSQANGAVVVDLRKEGVVYQVDYGVKLDGVLLICPNEQTMPFASWVSLQSSEVGIDYASLVGGFAVLKGESKSGHKTQNTEVSNPTEYPGCPGGCIPCSDGGCICYKED